MRHGARRPPRRGQRTPCASSSRRCRSRRRGRGRDEGRRGWRAARGPTTGLLKSDHAGVYAQYLAHTVLGIPALLATPSALTIYGARWDLPRAAMLAVSQSGASPDLLASAAASRDAGVAVVSVTNNAESELALLADAHIALAAGAELSVAATKTYTSELLALYLVIERMRGRDRAEIAQDVTAAIAAADRLLPVLGDVVAPHVDALHRADRVLLIGRGYSLATAKEGALKLMETSGVAASGWSAADATHGPLGQVVPGTPVLLLESSSIGRSSVATLGEAARRLGADVRRIDAQIDEAAVADALVPLVEVLILQQLALELSLRRGRNPDAPAGLTKVTRTL